MAMKPTQNSTRRITGSLNVSYTFGKVTKRGNISGKQIIKDDMYLQFFQ